MTTQENEYFWPMLKPSELAGCLNQCQLKVTENNIKKPNHDILMEIYTTLCQLISGEQPEDFENPNLEALEAAGITKLELYQDAICELNIYKAIVKLMKAAAIPNFSIQNDIFEAGGNKTIFNLSGLMNFAKFREVRLEFYTQLTQESEEYLVEKERLLDHQQQLKEQLRLLRKESEENQPILNELTQQENAYIQEINDLSHKQSQLRDESTRLKKQNQDYIEQIESITTVVETTELHTSRLKNGIIDKPEQQMELMANLREKIKNEQKQKNAMEKKNLHLRTKQEQVSKLHKELEKCLELLDKCKLEWDNSKQCNKENKTLQSSINEIKQKQIDTKRNMELNQKQQALATQRVERSLDKYKEKLNDLKNEFEELEQSYKATQVHVNTDLHQKICVHRAASKEIESKLQLLKREHHVFVSTLQQQQTVLFNELCELHQQIITKIELVDF